MEFVIWGLGAAGLGAGLGYLGYFHSKAAYSVFLIVMAVLAFISRYLTDLTGGQIGDSTVTQTAMIKAFKNVTSVIDGMGYLPTEAQFAIVVFIVTFFLGRLGTWAFKSFGPKPVPESTIERRKRILASYGMNNMDQVRRIR